jgi:hypothetical protein
MSEPNYIPTSQVLSDVSSLDVVDINGGKLRFGSLFESEKTIVVFIRHFFCGVCQEYVMQLASVSQEALVLANTKIIVIGCGDWQPIRNYLEITGFQGQMFADPTRKLYHALGMTAESLRLTPADVAKKSYIRSGLLSNVIRSIWSGPMKNPFLIGKQGKLSQLGGDFIFGPGNQCSFASHMQHTQDHVEVADLMQAAGVALANP